MGQSTWVSVLLVVLGTLILASASVAKNPMGLRHHLMKNSHPLVPLENDARFQLIGNPTDATSDTTIPTTSSSITTPPGPTTDEELFKETQKALGSIKKSYDELLDLTNNITATTVSPASTTASTTVASTSASNTETSTASTTEISTVSTTESLTTASTIEALTTASTTEASTTASTTEVSTTASTTESSTTASTKEASATASTTEASTLASTTEVSTTASTTEASTTASTTEASTTASTTEASTTASTTEAPTTASTTEASTSTSTTEASTTASTTEASTTASTTEASTTASTTEASTSASTTEVSTTASTTEASTTASTTEASTSASTTEASTTASTTEASTSASTTEASTTASTTEASTTASTTEASTTVSTTESSTTASTTEASTTISTTEVSTTAPTREALNAAVAKKSMFGLPHTRDDTCTTVICTDILETMDDIQKTTEGVEMWTVVDNNNNLTELKQEANTLEGQVVEAKDTTWNLDDAASFQNQVEAKKEDLDETAETVDNKVKVFEKMETDSIIFVSVIGTVGGLIIIALIGTSVYAFIAKRKKDGKVGLDGPAADIPMKELDRPQDQEPRNAPEKETLSEPQKINPYYNQAPREPATDVRRYSSARDPYSAQPAKNPPRDIERSASSRAGYSDQPTGYPPRNREQSTSSRDPNVTREPRGLSRSDDPFAPQSHKKQPPVVPKKPQGYNRSLAPYNSQQQDPNSRHDSTDSNANNFIVPRVMSDPRIPKAQTGPYDDRSRGAGPSRDPYSQSPPRSGSRPTQPSNYY